jgi:predicted xylose isomerase-like sugar epimerase
MRSAALMTRLEKTGYRGMYSFEPFSASVQALSAKELASTLRASIEYLAHA